MRIGVLAVQGAFAEHADMLRRLGAEVLELRRREDVVNQHFDGLILPGGESTVMGKLLRELDMFAPLREEITRGLPVFGTCAGMILLAKTVVNDGCADSAAWISPCAATPTAGSWGAFPCRRRLPVFPVKSRWCLSVPPTWRRYNRRK